jgi:hypothetical protein
MRTVIINAYFGLKIAFHWVTEDVGRALFSCYFLLILGFGVFKAVFLLFVFLPLIAAVWIVAGCVAALGLACGSDAKKDDP